MSVSLKSQKDVKSPCKYGAQCEFLKSGTCKFSHKGNPKADHKMKARAGTALVKQVKVSPSVLTCLAAAMKNVAARKVLSAEIEKAKSVYFDVKDAKDVALPSSSGAARELKLLDDELLMMRAAVKGMFKQNQNFRLSVFYGWQLSTQVTTGVVSGTQTVDPSGQTEWIAAAALFDEYKIDSLEVLYRIKTGVNYSSTVYPFYVICYDPTDSNALTTVFIGCAQQQHQKGLVPSTFEANATHGQPATFRVVVPKGIQDTDATSLGTGSWLPVASPLPYGYLKFYCIGDQITAITNGGFGAVVTVNNVFRIRE